MDVRVDEAGQEDEPVGLDGLELRPGQVRPDLGDHALVDANVERVAVETRGGIDDAGAGDQDVGGRSGLRMRAAPSRHLLSGGGDDIGRHDAEGGLGVRLSGAGEEIVEDSHPNHEPRPDLIDDA